MRRSISGELARDDPNVVISVASAAIRSREARSADFREWPPNKRLQPAAPSEVMRRRG